MSTTISIPVLKANGEKCRHREMMAALREQFPDDIPEDAVLRFCNGDPALNHNTILLLNGLVPLDISVHAEVSTVLPQAADIPDYLNCLINTINEVYRAKCTLRLLLGSTSERSRRHLFENPFGLASLAKLFEKLPAINPGQKIILSFDPFCPVDSTKIARSFSPEQFAIEFHELHPTDTVKKETSLFGHTELEKELQSLGYTVYPQGGDAYGA